MLTVWLQQKMKRNECRDTIFLNGCFALCCALTNAVTEKRKLPKVHKLEKRIPICQNHAIAYLTFW